MVMQTEMFATMDLLHASNDHERGDRNANPAKEERNENRGGKKEDDNPPKTPIEPFEYHRELGVKNWHRRIRRCLYGKNKI